MDEAVTREEATSRPDEFSRGTRDRGGCPCTARPNHTAAVFLEEALERHVRWVGSEAFNGTPLDRLPRTKRDLKVHSRCANGLPAPRDAMTDRGSADTRGTWWGPPCRRRASPAAAGYREPSRVTEYGLLGFLPVNAWPRCDWVGQCTDLHLGPLPASGAKNSSGRLDEFSPPPTQLPIHSIPR